MLTGQDRFVAFLGHAAEVGLSVGGLVAHAGSVVGAAAIEAAEEAAVLRYEFVSQVELFLQKGARVRECGYARITYITSGVAILLFLVVRRRADHGRAQQAEKE